MGKRKEMEKNLNDDQQNGASSFSSGSSSAASSSLTIRRSARINEKTTTTLASQPQSHLPKPVGKKQKTLNGKESSNSKAQKKIAHETTIQDLPAEMVTQILKKLSSRSLINCRLVNRQWSAISTGILRKTSPICNRFLFEEGKFKSRDWRTRKNLEHFVQCMKKSKNCLSFHFQFYMRQLQSFDDEHFKALLSLFPALQFKSLSLNLSPPGNMNELHNYVEKLRNILLKEIPHLEKFELAWETPYSSKADAAQVKLFPDKNATTGATKFELPHLKVLHFRQGMISIYPEICRNLSNAATNLDRIRARIETPEDFLFLQTFGKLHLVKEAHTDVTFQFSQLISNQREPITWPLTLPDLEVLKLSVSSAADISKIKSFLANLLESCKDSLKELTIFQDQFALLEFEFPTFKNLRKLTIWSWKRTIFPSGTSSRDIFPAVDSLELRVDDWSMAFLQPDSIPQLPSMKTLCLRQDFYDEEVDISKVAKLCPNLLKLQIYKHGSYCNYENWKPLLPFLEFSRSIWTHMTRLESLEIDLDVGGPKHRASILDSSFTGISRGNCVQLRKMETARIAEEKHSNGILPVGIPESKLTALTQREHPSILNMQDLKKLTINPYFKGKALDKKEFFSKTLSWISHEYAFKLLPHLQLHEGTYESSCRLWN